MDADFNISSVIEQLQGLRLISSLKWRNPENPNKQAVISLRSERVPELFASLTIASSISTVIGSFFAIGFANVRCRPSNVVLTNGCKEGVVRPALENISTCNG